MTTPHTPGPWTIRAADRAIVPVSDPARLVAHGGAIHPDDAALIAAAPELLAALQAIAVMTDEDPGTFRKRGGTYRGLVGEIARAAIARATDQA